MALALGGLVGGVLAESRSATASTAAPVALADRALAGAAGGVGAPALAALEAAGAGAAARRCGFSRSSASRTSCAGGDGRSVVPPALRGRASPRRSVRRRGRGRHARARLARPHQARVPGWRCATGRPHGSFLPGSSRPFGVIGDALIELGRYDAAFAAFERMVTLRPSLASYARIAYARELVGDREGAVEAMTARARRRRRSAGADRVGERRARQARARLSGTRKRRGAHARTALRVLPGYPSARIELARIDAACGTARRGDRRGAPSSRRDPDVGFGRRFSRICSSATAALADAQRQRATIAVIDRLLEANGVQVDLESAVARADNRVRPRRDRRARAARLAPRQPVDLRRRRTRVGAGARRPLRRGGPTREAGAAARHRGRAPLVPPRLRGGLRGRRVARCARAYRRALALDPQFSVRWAPVARAALRNG